jgi:hypothetical protein
MSLCLCQPRFAFTAFHGLCDLMTFHIYFHLHSTLHPHYLFNLGVHTATPASSESLDGVLYVIAWLTSCDLKVVCCLATAFSASCCSHNCPGQSIAVVLSLDLQNINVLEIKAPYF